MNFSSIRIIGTAQCDMIQRDDFLAFRGKKLGALNVAPNDDFDGNERFAAVGSQLTGGVM
jgi:hypothetical protein|uniref:hypothetical protein n=1 Tax=Cephaloticoccus sp. TaxID=1985742 RepID=UPI00404944E8